MIPAGLVRSSVGTVEHQLRVPCCRHTLGLRETGGSTRTGYAVQGLVPVLVGWKDHLAVALDRLADVIAQLVNLLTQGKFIDEQHSTLMETLALVEPGILVQVVGNSLNGK